MVAIRERLFLSESGTALPAPSTHNIASTSTISGEEYGAVRIEFGDTHRSEGDNDLTSAHRDSFRADLLRERAAVLSWFARHDWWPDALPDLHVIVSERFRISKSLVPAWSGRRGLMEFPTARVIAGNAAVAHELTHVYFPNANRLLAEGLAIYVQAEAGGNPAFPNFGAPLHGQARKVLGDVIPPAVGAHGREVHGHEARPATVGLAALDALATPNPLTATIAGNDYGEEPRGQRVLYSIAGSFVAHLIETRGMTVFRKLYVQTPLRPQYCDAGRPDRWANVYGLSITELELEWKSVIANHDHGDVVR
jgi:hypothetical protein